MYSWRRLVAATIACTVTSLSRRVVPSLWYTSTTALGAMLFQKPAIHVAAVMLMICGAARFAPDTDALTTPTFAAAAAAVPGP